MSTKFFVFLPIDQVKKRLKFDKNRGEIEPNEFDAILRKRGKNTLIEIVRTGRNFDVTYTLGELKMAFADALIDHDSIERANDILTLNPNDDYVAGILDDLKMGLPLTSTGESVLESREDNIAFPDEEALEAVTKALASAPNHPFVKSVSTSFYGGRELTEAQIEALKKFSRPLKPRAQRDWAKEHRDLIDRALVAEPQNAFLKKLQSDLTRDTSRQLSRKQKEIVDQILQSASNAQTPMLNDLEQNGRYLRREDYELIRKAKRNLSSLSEDERRRVRHLIYKNERNLYGDYDKDDVRAMFKKASIRRVASLYLSRQG